MKNICYFKMPFCKIGIAEENNFITDIFFVDEQRPISQDALITPVIKKAADQLYEYFAGKRRNFDLPLFCHGSKFQLQVWQALETIPYGETRSYKEIAQLINNPRACRAVGQANNCNPIAIVIPCHRVIGADGSLVGYAGRLDLKEKLLRLEGVNLTTKL